MQDQVNRTTVHQQLPKPKKKLEDKKETLSNYILHGSYRYAI